MMLQPSAPKYTREPSRPVVVRRVLHMLEDNRHTAEGIQHRRR